MGGKDNAHFSGKNSDSQTLNFNYKILKIIIYIVASYLNVISHPFYDHGEWTAFIESPH